MIKPFWLCLACFLLIANISIAKISNKADSLIHLLDHTTDPHKKVELLNKIAWKLRKPETAKALKYANQAVILADSINYKYGKANALLQKANVLQLSDKNKEAIQTINFALAIFIQIENKGKMASCYYNLGLFHNTDGSYLKSIASFQQALVIYQELGKKTNITSCEYNTGVVYTSLNMHQKAIDHLNKALLLEQELDDKEGIANCYIWIGNVYDSWGNYEKAGEYFIKANEIFKKINDQEGVAFCLNNLGNIYEVWGKYKLAINYFNEALVLVQHLQDSATIAGTQLNLGNCYLNLGDYQKGESYFSKAMEVIEDIADDELKALCITHWADLSARRGKYHEAITFYHESLAIEKKLQNESKIAGCMNNIGQVHESLTNYKKAEHYYNDALKIYLALNEANGIANSYFKLGSLYTQLDKTELAIEQFKKAIKINNQIGDINAYADCTLALGEIHLSRKEYLLAHDKLEESLDIYQDIKNEASIAKTYILLGRVYAKTKQHKKAITYYFNSLKIALPLNEQNCIKHTYEALAEVYEDLNQFDQAYKYHKLFKASNDSLFNLESNVKINQLESKYELVQKEQQIAIQETQLAKKDLEIRQQKLIRRIMYAAFIVGIFILVLIILAYIQKKKAHTLILQQKNDIDIKNKALEAQKEEILQQNENLHQQNEEILTQRDEIEQQKHRLLKINQNVRDSITYAERIQHSMLPKEAILESYLSEYFIFYKPRDIVSGDFYWFKEINNHLVIAAVDCTGHGVPGAFMSMLGMSLLNEVVDEKLVEAPDLILNKLREKVKLALKQQGILGESVDGMEMALLSINLETKELQFSGAYNPLYIIRNKELKVIKADRQPVAVYLKEKPFSKQVMQLEKDDCLYLFSDGYLDQFTSDGNRKFLSSNFKKLLVKNHELPFSMQKTALQNTMDTWRKGFEQMDDFMVIGLKI